MNCGLAARRVTWTARHAACKVNTASAAPGYRIADAATTAIPRYTRRPRKRTDIDVMRRRQRLQQKLKRVSYSARTALKQARGLRG